MSAITQQAHTPFAPGVGTETGRHPRSPEATTASWSLGRLVALHLLPGVVIAAAFMLFAWLARPLGWPATLSFLLAIPVALLPTELGIMLYHGKRLHGRYSLRGVIGYDERPSLKDVAIWAPLGVVAAIVLFTLTGGADAVVYEHLFSWWPGWMNLASLGLVGQPQRIVFITLTLQILFSNLLGPVVEELYFRGFLLSRMEHLGRWGIVLNAALFGLYHLWSPWYAISRLAGTLPMGFIAQHKRSVVLPAVIHCALNNIGTLLVLGALFGS